jgi:carboxyl-terminal processing protease
MDRFMTKIFQIVVMVLVLWDSQCAGGTERTNVTSSTETRVILGEDKREPEHNEFNPAECFDKIWGIIKDEFWDKNYNGLDWEDARKRYRPKALAAEDHESFAVVVNQMLGELKTSHTRYFTRWEPEYYTIQAVFVSGSLAVFATSDTSVVEEHWPGVFSSQANPHRVGIGVGTRKIDDRHYVTVVLSTSPAEKAGIVLGDWLVKVDGQPFHPIRSFEGRADKEVEMTFQRGSSVSTRRLIKITPIDSRERELLEGDSHASVKLIEYGGHQFTYFHLWWLNGWSMDKVLKKGIALRKSEGMIIDIRDGFGGMLGFEYIAPFLQYGLGKITLEAIWQGRTMKVPVGFNKPVVVLINGGSRSGKELLAYYFKKTGRGLLVGERTAGFVSGGRWKRISKDSMLYFCENMLFIDGERLEGVGVEPDIEVPFDIRFAAGKDIQLQQAKDEMVRLIEASS